MRKLAALLIVVFLGATAGRVEAREFKEIPLPSHIIIFEPAKELDDNSKMFLGVWEGKWGGSLTSILIVTHIDPETEIVKGIYGWGKGRNFDTGSAPFTGKIGLGKKNNKVLWFALYKTDVSFRVPRRDPTLLKGKVKSGESRSEGWFSRTQIDTDPASLGKALTEIPEAYRTFLGEWCGLWNNEYRTRLAVMGVNHEGAVSGFYIMSLMRNYTIFSGTIEDGELRFTLKNGAEQRYRLENDGTLSGTDRRPSSISTTRSKRCD